MTAFQSQTQVSGPPAPLRFALTHHTCYRFERPVWIFPHEIRLRPAPHCRTPVSDYALTLSPKPKSLHWLQDAYANFVGRAVFDEPAERLGITVKLVADLIAINPFDFFIEDYAMNHPFRYPPAMAAPLAPYLETAASGPLLAQWLERWKAEYSRQEIGTVALLVELNRRLAGEIAYRSRFEPGVQTPEETLQLGIGSCRDSAWLLVQILRRLGLATRFVSGYSIQPKFSGSGAYESASADLHAWAEAFVPGAGWIGMDPTSGLLTESGHIPLACSVEPAGAAAVIGATHMNEDKLEHRIEVVRVQ